MRYHSRPQVWHPIDLIGHPVYGDRHRWCGNFVQGRCTVQASNWLFYHILPDGRPACNERYQYVGGYSEGYACALTPEGYTHIDMDGKLLHRQFYAELGVFHRGMRDGQNFEGWVHIDRHGHPLYSIVFDMLEPFYNGVAYAVGANGQRYRVYEKGDREQIV